MSTGRRTFPASPAGLALGTRLAHADEARPLTKQTQLKK